MSVLVNGAIYVPVEEHLAKLCTERKYDWQLKSVTTYAHKFRG